MNEIEKSLQEMGVKFSIKFLDYKRYFDDDKDRRNVYRFTLSRKTGNLGNGRAIVARYSGTFGDSINNSLKADSQPPTAADVLGCLTWFEPGTHEEFCDNYGYDVDSIRCLKIYKAVRKEYAGLCRIFNAEERQILDTILTA
jgi:hypothetical protein